MWYIASKPEVFIEGKYTFLHPTVSIQFTTHNKLMQYSNLYIKLFHYMQEQTALNWSLLTQI